MATTAREVDVVVEEAVDETTMKLEANVTMDTKRTKDSREEVAAVAIISKGLMAAISGMADVEMVMNATT